MNKKQLRWEYLPPFILYIPVYFKIALDAVRLRSLTYFTVVNPGLKHGGLVSYSKWSILKQLSPEYIPKSLYISKKIPMDQLLSLLSESGITYPFIMKPDVGERCFLTAIIKDEVMLREYLSLGRYPMLAQEYLQYKAEYGIQYAKFDGVSQITGIVLKEPLYVVGDGKSSLGDLVASSHRASLHSKMLEKLYADKYEGYLDRIPEKDEYVKLIKLNCHCMGATFQDGSHLATESLRILLDDILRNLDGFCLGRVDLLADSFEELLEGKFKLVEVNGLNGEAAHAYDPDNRLIDAYKVILNHWDIVGKISASHLSAGVTPSSVYQLAKDGFKFLWEQKRYNSKMAKLQSYKDYIS